MLRTHLMLVTELGQPSLFHSCPCSKYEYLLDFWLFFGSFLKFLCVQWYLALDCIASWNKMIMTDMWLIEIENFWIIDLITKQSMWRQTKQVLQSHCLTGHLSRMEAVRYIFILSIIIIAIMKSPFSLHTFEVIFYFITLFHENGFKY